MLTVLMMVVMTVLMVVWLFVFRKGEKNVLSGWCLGFCFAFVFLFSFSLMCLLFKNATASGSEDFFCDHLD